MHENNFENQVREKMGDLGFDPSDSVWKKLEKEIGLQKKRHLPLFWIFFLSAIGISAPAYYLLDSLNAATESIHAQLPSAGQSKIKFKSDTGKLTRKIPAAAGTKDSVIASSFEEKGIWNEQIGQSIPFELNNVKTTKTLPVPQSYSLLNRLDNSATSNYLTTAKNQANKTIDSSKAFNSLPVSRKDTIRSNSFLINPQPTKSATNKNIKYPWRLAFSVGAGGSVIKQDIFKSTNRYDPAMNTSASPNNGTGTGPTTGDQEGTSGFAYNIGASLSRNISHRFSLTAGMNYEYFSTKIITGKLVNSPLASAGSIAQSNTVTAYYAGGNGLSHSNHYHFVEFPLTIGYKLNKSNKHPILWEAGVTISYLLAADALYFDQTANVYYKNNQALNKLQFNVVTAVVLGFPLLRGVIEAGPQLQYGLTPMVRTGQGNAGHSVYTGVKINFFPAFK